MIDDEKYLDAPIANRVKSKKFGFKSYDPTIYLRDDSPFSQNEEIVNPEKAEIEPKYGVLIFDDDKQGKLY